MKHHPARPTERVIMLTMTEPGGPRILGALEDGTIFERDPAAGWRTINGPGDPDESFELLTSIAAVSEANGGHVTAAPAEFGIDTATCDDIRGERWDRAETSLLIGRDMAARTRQL